MLVRTRDLWLPALLLISGCLVSLAAWSLLVDDRRRQISDSAAETVAETGDAVALRLETQVEALRALAQRWGRFGVGSRAEWQAEAGALLDRLPGLRGLAWMDLETPGLPMAYAEANPAHRLAISPEELRRHDGPPHFSEVERGESGELRYRVFLPARADGSAAGVLVAGVAIAEFLEPLLRGRARGYALSVRGSNEEIFARGTPTSASRHGWWQARERIDLPLGGTWELVLRPTPDLAAARLTPLPHYLLAAGMLTSLLLAVLAHQLRLTARQARFLAAANRALEERGGELSELNVELESRVSQRTEELREAVSELEAFNYSVSHDLRSPLGAILNFAAILEEDHRGRPLEGDAVALLHRIQRSASRASNLLEDLLRLSRAGRAALDLEDLDLEALSREAFALVRAAEGDDEVQLVVAPLPRARGDRDLIVDVLTNLFSNAFKYSRGREKRRVVVDGADDGDQSVYRVSDNGIGFDGRFAEKVFGVFERLHSDEEVEGTGVGLAIVARIVKRHGGRVCAEGTPGKGACISFSLPRAEEARA